MVKNINYEAPHYAISSLSHPNKDVLIYSEEQK
jgi:hypothetical protein